MKIDWHYDYKHRYALDEGEKISFSETDWEIVPVGHRFIIRANGEVSKSADTLEEALGIIWEIRADAADIENRNEAFLQKMI